MADDEDFERCPACGSGLEPRVIAEGSSLETVEEAILEGSQASSGAMVCPNPACPNRGSDAAPGNP